MSRQHQPFTYIPLPNTALIVCPDYGVEANFVACLPHSEQLNAEIRTFTCNDFGKQSQMTVRN